MQGMHVLQWKFAKMFIFSQTQLSWMENDYQITLVFKKIVFLIHVLNLILEPVQIIYG